MLARSAENDPMMNTKVIKGSCVLNEHESISKYLR